MCCPWKWHSIFPWGGWMLSSCTFQTNKQRKKKEKVIQQEKRVQKRECGPLHPHCPGVEEDRAQPWEEGSTVKPFSLLLSLSKKGFHKYLSKDYNGSEITLARLGLELGWTRKQDCMDSGFYCGSKQRGASTGPAPPHWQGIFVNLFSN